jgi:hypothetical protein
VTDFVISGQPYEPPESAAEQGYAQTPAPFLSRVGAEAQSGITYGLGRAIERGSQSDATSLDRALFESVQSAGEGLPPAAGYEPQQSDMLPPAEINKRYAPIGPDGKLASITDKPMSEGLGQIIGKQKTDEMQRESVIARNAAANSWPVNLGTGMAAFMLDPINAATSFIPGIGEEAAMAALGRVGVQGFAARMAARGVAGATSMGAQQVPLSLAEYGLGTEEASDFSLRDAMSQIFYGAMWGAAIHAGAFGTARELGILRPDAVMGRPLGEPESLGALDEAGRADAEAMMYIGTAREAAEAEALRWMRGPEPSDLETDMLAELNAEPAAAREDAAAVTTQPAPVRAAAMHAAIAESLDGRPVDVQPVVDAAETRREPASTPASTAATQSQLARDGYATGVPAQDLAATTEALYAPKAADDVAPAEPTAQTTARPAQTPPGENEAAPGPPKTTRVADVLAGRPEPEQGASASQEGEQATLPLDPETAAAVQRLAAYSHLLSPEDHAEIAAADAAAQDAEQQAAGLTEAAACLKGGA